MEKNNIKLIKRVELFEFDYPLAEMSDISEWRYEQKYYIERIEHPDKSIVWYGNSVNWKKEKDSPWTVLSTNYNAKPLEKYLPDIVYGDDRTYWKECEEPIYERLRNNMK